MFTLSDNHMVLEEAEFQFHHIAFGTKRLLEDQKIYMDIGFQIERPLFVSQANRIRGVFLMLGETRIELIEDVDGGSKISNQLQNRTTIIHTAYKVRNINEAIKKIKHSFMCTLPKDVYENDSYPDPTFIMLKNGTIVELLCDY
jgi:hypothetical protein